MPYSVNNHSGEGENDSDALKTSYHALSITCEHLKRRLGDSELKQKLLQKKNTELLQNKENSNSLVTVSSYKSN